MLFCKYCSNEKNLNFLAEYVAGVLMKNQRFKNLILMILDFLYVIVGIFLLTLGFVRWKNVGFVIERWGEPSLFEGHASIVLMLLGFGLVSYGIADYWIFRKSDDRDR